LKDNNVIVPARLSKYIKDGIYELRVHHKNKISRSFYFYYVDKNGKETSIDIKNPNPFKTYRIAIDDYIAKGGNNYFTWKPEEIEVKYNFDKNKPVSDYIKKLNAPIVISDEKRITIEEN